VFYGHGVQVGSEDHLTCLPWHSTFDTTS
jgi:hypothetical protein